MSKTQAIEEISSKKLKGNKLRKAIEKAFPDMKGKIFTHDMLRIADKIEGYQGREDWGSPIFKKKLYLFIEKTMKNATFNAGVKRKYFLFDKKTLPEELTNTEKIMETYNDRPNDLVIREGSVDNKTGVKVEEIFIYENSDKKGYRPKLITEESLNLAIEAVKKKAKAEEPEIINETEEDHAEAPQTDHPQKVDPRQKTQIGSEDFLVVPFEDRDRAFKAGARYTHQYNNTQGESRKIFYAPKTADREKLKTWEMKEQQEKVRMEYADVTKIGSSGKHPEAEFAEILQQLDLDVGSEGVKEVNHSTFITERTIPLKEIGTGKSNKPGSYKYAVDEAGFAYGWAKNNHSGEKITYDQRQDLDVKEKNREIAHIENQIKIINSVKAKRILKQTRTDAALKCQEEYSEATPMTTASENEYMKKKQMDVYPSIRQKGKTLIIPLYKLNDPSSLVSHQKIGNVPNNETGEWEMKKRYAYQAEKDGVFTIISKDKDMTVEKMDIAYLTEGVSTAASINKATGLPVLVTLDAGNMPKVAKEISEMYPEKKIVVLADNDHHKVIAGERDPSLNMSQKENSGLKAALKVEKDVGGVYVLPSFSNEDLEEKLSDWNDIHVKHGLEEVRKQIFTTLRKLGIDPEAKKSPVEKKKEDIKKNSAVKTKKQRP